MNIFVKRVIRVIFLNYVLFTSLLVTVEIAGQLYSKVAYGKFLFETSTTIFREHPYLSAAPEINSQLRDDEGVRKISTNHLGYRVTGKNDYRSEATNVVCIGGSTTFCTGLTDEHTWPYILQQKLGDDYRVYNLGVPGYTTLESIIQLSTIVPELDPDVIILYQGWNDIRNYHADPPTPDYYWHGMTQKTNLNVGKKEFRDGFFLIHLARKLKGILVAPVDPVTYVSANSDPFVDSLYVRNLKMIQSICEHLDVKIIFIPQVLNISGYNTSAEKSDYWTPTIENTAMPALIRKFNLLGQNSFARNNRTIIVDSVLDHPWRSGHFIDKAHFSKTGGEYFVGKIVLDALKSAEALK